MLEKPVYFISDIHLGLESSEREYKKERLLESFLRFTKETAGELYIVGDLFDYWFEYRRTYQKGFFRTLTALQNVVEAGIPVHYLIGNHDFMHRDFFSKEIGVDLVSNEIDVTYEDKRFFIAHGDGMVENDMGYNILKKILRNSFFQWLYSLIHPDIGISLASGTSKTSRTYTKNKNYGERDGLFNAAKKIIDSGFDYVIFGHLHQKQEIVHNHGTYINLGTWLEAPCYGKYYNKKFEIIAWDKHETRDNDSSTK